MNRAVTMFLSLVLLLLGALTVYSFPLNALAISLGMFLLAVSILSIALQIYFPPKPKHVVLRVVEPAKIPKTRVKARVRRKKVKKAKKKAKKAKTKKRTRRTRKRR